ncbi:hypothetical protein QQ008_12065 [Fulvivirgaceae bacterium BMA10]|uniref:PKD/Chitinase domain-containing protein n=1 Tax=Splendidivirga corallicola TaxID=3051826 RepID=A0ABT8KPF5_9BACT|nr:hypothetical protein [Fulvivirgaceae bacterium BMA10]
MKKILFLNGGLSIIILSLILINVSGCGNEDTPDPSGTLTANAGNDTNVITGEKVTLNGNGSFDQQGGAFNFSWKFISKPSGSTATLSDQDQAIPSFTTDLAGKYKVELTISNSQNNSMDTVTVAAFSVATIPGTYNNLLPGPDVGVREFEVLNGQIYVTCEFNEIGGIVYKKIACFNGASWSALGCGLEDGSIFDMVAYQNELYVTGQFDQIGCIDAKNIARWDGFNWKAVDSGIGSGDDEAGYALEVYQDELYVGGRFTRAGSLTVNNIAKWNGTQWSNIGSLEDGSVRVLKVYQDRLYAGGFFTEVPGTNAQFIACFDGSQWSGLGSTENLELGSTGVVRHMAVFQNQLFLSGDFEVDNNEFSELVTWDGSKLSDFGRAFSLFSGNEINALATFKDALYIGGSFNQVVGTQASSILRWDGQLWGIMTEGIDGTVLSIQPFQDRLYVGGEFDRAGNQVAEHITIWDNP